MTMLMAFSCASNKNIKTRKLASADELKLDDDYNWLESLNFDKKSEKKFVASEDKFKEIVPEEKNAVTKESVATIQPDLLGAELKKPQDTLSLIIFNCYKGQFDDAFQMIEKHYAEYKTNPSYWNQVGSCYYLQGEFSKAILFYNKSRDFSANYAPALNNLGVVYEKQGRFQKALVAYKKASELNAFSSSVNLNLARLYLKFGLSEKAKPLISSLYNRSPKDPLVLNAIAVLALQNQQYLQAVEYYKSLGQVELTKPDFGLNYTLALFYAGKVNEARQFFQKISDVSGELKRYADEVNVVIQNSIVSDENEKETL